MLEYFNIFPKMVKLTLIIKSN